MIDRNGSNLIVWEKPDGNRLLVERRDDVYSSVEEVFALEVTNNLQRENEVLVFNADVQIDCESSGGEITVFLRVLGNPPYILRRNGDVIEQELDPQDFPYVDSSPDSGENCYEIEDFDSNTDETCCTV